VIFVVDFSYWNGTLFNFCGSNANYLYSILKQKSFKWQIFHTASLSRLDLCFERNSKTLNATSTNNFLDHCFRNLQKLNKKTTLEKNRNGWILKIGNRRSNNYFRVYKKQETSLRFEHEMKGKPLREYFVLLMEDNFEEFEQKLSLHFIVSFGKLFSLNSVYLDWLAIKLRPIRQYKIPKSYFNSHYIGFNNFNSFENRQGFFNLLQFLVYVNDLDYTMGHLDSTTYRLVVFKVQDFLKYQNPTVKSTNYYQLKKVLNFIQELQKNSIIQSFSDREFRCLITIPEVKLTKSNRNTWYARVWVAEELFYYPYPFMIPNLTGKRTRDQFEVQFKVIQTFSTINIEKKFLIKDFLDSYSSSLSNYQIKNIKKEFIKWVEILKQNDLIENNYEIIQNGQYHRTYQLTTTRFIKEGS